MIFQMGVIDFSLYLNNRINDDLSPDNERYVIIKQRVYISLNIKCVVKGNNLYYHTPFVGLAIYAVKISYFQL